MVKKIISLAQFKSAFMDKDPDFPIFKACTIFSWKFQKGEMFLLVEPHPVLRDRPLEKLLGVGWGIFEQQEFFPISNCLLELF